MKMDDISDLLQELWNVLYLRAFVGYYFLGNYFRPFDVNYFVGKYFLGNWLVRWVERFGLMPV